MHRELPNRALVSKIERKARVEVIEVEVQVMVEVEVVPQGYRQSLALRPEFML